MDIEKALAKIRKCFELAASSNEHEAAAAMRQASALMKKFNLDRSSVIASEANVKSSVRSRPPEWEKLLALTVAHQLECTLMSRVVKGKRFDWVFIGRHGRPEMAVYAFEVLSRQVKVARERFLLRSDVCTLSTGQKRKLASRYSLGWVARVAAIVTQFAGAAKQDPVVAEYIAQKHGDVPEGKRIKDLKRFQGNDLIAFRIGAADGAEAQLHRGVGDGVRPALLE